MIRVRIILVACLVCIGFWNINACLLLGYNRYLVSSILFMNALRFIT